MTNDQDQQQQPAHEPMTAARLAAIREHVSKASPGPWTSDACSLYVHGDDARFAEHARQDVPDLLTFAEAALPILRAMAIYPDFTDQDLGIGLLRMQARALMAGTGESADEGGES